MFHSLAYKQQQCELNCSGLGSRICFPLSLFFYTPQNSSKCFALLFTMTNVFSCSCVSYIHICPAYKCVSPRFLSSLTGIVSSHCLGSSGLYFSHILLRSIKTQSMAICSSIETSLVASHCSSMVSTLHNGLQATLITLLSVGLLISPPFPFRIPVILTQFCMFQ